MRGTRGLLLLAIAVIAGAVGASYFYLKQAQERQAPPRPQPLPVNTDAAASDWTWSKEGKEGSLVEVRARNFRQIKDPPVIQLEQVELHIYDKDKKRFDQVKSASAQFSTTEGKLYSDGDVEITTGLPVNGETPGRTVTIQTSGVSFDSRTNRAWTDRPAAFTFDRSEGKCVGAWYDPVSRELHMNSQVQLDWRGGDPKTPPMRVEAGELSYKEQDSKIYLYKWARLTRQKAVLESGNATVFLQDGAIQHVEAVHAKGKDAQPSRQVDYAADQLNVEFTPEGQVQKVVGERNARLVSVSDSGRTTVTSNRVDLNYEAAGAESTLRNALASGNSYLESSPAAKNGNSPESKALRADVIEMEMMPGGRDIREIKTHTPGYLEFLPNRPEQRHRRLDGERMTLDYAPGNRLETFRASNVTTRTDPLPAAKGKQAAPMLTRSKDLFAFFDPNTGQVIRMQQWNDFHYEEGTRRGQSQNAVLDQARQTITLEQAARVWDDTGTTSADKIVMDQKSGAVTATGNVSSTRQPDDKKAGAGGGLFTQDQPLEAKADRMDTADRNQLIRYEGNAAVWQGANRVRADFIEIDRNARCLHARGHVRTQLLDTEDRGKQKANGARVTQASAAPRFVTVEAAELVYTDQDRLAHYTGGSHMTRPGMDVKSSEIRAWLSDSKEGSSLDHAFADGKVEILKTDPGRTRRGAAEHAEYYAADERIVLKGGEPTLVDSRRGSTRGKELTYYASNDKLLVNGVEQDPVVTRIRRP